MITTDKAARQLYEEAQREAGRIPFGFGDRCAIINIDLQRGFVDTVNFNGYETDPNQFAYINRLSQLCRLRGFPVIWTENVHNPDAEDFGVRGIRRPGPAAVQGMVEGAPAAEFDPRSDVQRGTDFILRKRMPSSFFETHLQSLLVSQRVDTLIVTGGSTSGCVRSTVVEAFSRGYRSIVPEECVADPHESPHFASLYDMHLKYADVLPFAQVEAWLARSRD